MGEFVGLVWEEGKRKDGKFECDAIQCEGSSRVEQTRLVGVDRGGAAARYLLVRYHPICAYRDDKAIFRNKLLGMQLSNVRTAI